MYIPDLDYASVEQQAGGETSPNEESVALWSWAANRHRLDDCVVDFIVFFWPGPIIAGSAAPQCAAQWSYVGLEALEVVELPT